MAFTTLLNLLLTCMQSHRGSSHATHTDHADDELSSHPVSSISSTPSQLEVELQLVLTLLSCRYFPIVAIWSIIGFSIIMLIIPDIF